MGLFVIGMEGALTRSRGSYLPHDTASMGGEKLSSGCLYVPHSQIIQHRI